MINDERQTYHSSGKRILWIDTAKAIGIFLVFYGHLIEPLIKINSTAYLQFKFINAFHMPFFFLVSGFFLKTTYKPIQRIKTLFLRRIIPVFAFGILTLPFWIGRELFFSSTPNWEKIAHNIFQYVKGNPDINVITWFLICLFTTEVLALFIRNIFKSKKAIAIIGIISLIFGLFICKHMYFLTRVSHIPKNFWYIHESPVALGFYLLGYIVYPKISNSKGNYIKTAFFALICFLILFYTLYTFYTFYTFYTLYVFYI